MGKRAKDELIGRRFGPFELISQIGKGGMATVYRAEHVQIRKRVAIKVLSEDMARREKIVHRFFNEAAAVNEIGHENIVDIIDFGESDDGLFYFVMELLEGEPLKMALRREQTLGVERTSFIVQQVASALQAAHDKGIIHRDLKPDNIFLTRRLGLSDYVKVLDFGVAKLADDGSGSHTRTGLLLGTPKYMSPEQTEGSGIGPRSDIWSLGVLTYQMLTGTQPFDAPSVPAIIKKICFTEPTPPRELAPDIPEEVAAVIARALEKDADKRYQSMSDLARHLREATGVAIDTDIRRALPTQDVGDGEPTTLRSGAVEISEASERKSGWLAPLLGVAALLAAGLAIGSWMALSPSDHDTAAGGGVEEEGAAEADDEEGFDPADLILPWDDKPADDVAGETDEAPTVDGVAAEELPGLDPEVIAETLAAVDLEACRSRDSGDVRVRGSIARDGVPFKVRAHPDTAAKLAECVVRALRETTFPEFEGRAVAFDSVVRVEPRPTPSPTKPRAPTRPSSDKPTPKPTPTPTPKTAAPTFDLDD